MLFCYFVRTIDETSGFKTPILVATLTLSFRLNGDASGFGDVRGPTGRNLGTDVPFSGTKVFVCDETWAP